MKQKLNFLDRKVDIIRWYKKIFLEVRTQILLCYLGLLLVLIGISIPTFYWMFIRQINRRLYAEVDSEIIEFKEHFLAKNFQNLSQLQQEKIAYLRNDLLEDNQYFIIALKEGFFQSSPLIHELPRVLKPNSAFIKQLISKEQPDSGEFPSQDPQIGKIIYSSLTFNLQGEERGVFIVAHATSDEYQKAALSMRLIVGITIALFLLTCVGAWLISGWILKPLRVMSATAKQISERDLSQRLPVWGQGEMAEVAKTFNEMMERLQKAFLSQRNFVSHASHELKTPITIVQGHLDLMGDNPEEQQQTLTIINEELARMNKLVQDLLTLAKAEQPNFWQPKLVEVSIFTTEFYQQAQISTKANLQLEALGQGNVYIDSERLTQAMMNLVENAVQHTPPGGIIFIGSTGNNLDIRFWVKDTGAGIALSDQKQIFSPFVRAANSYRRSDGSGLGLSIAQAIVNTGGGNITLDSFPGQGSTFTLIFPPPKV